MIDPVDRWEPCLTEIRMTGGPERIYDDQPTEHHPKPVGFTAALHETEPMLWEGDQA